MPCGWNTRGLRSSYWVVRCTYMYIGASKYQYVMNTGILITLFWDFFQLYSSSLLYWPNTATGSSINHSAVQQYFLRLWTNKRYRQATKIFGHKDLRYQNWTRLHSIVFPNCKIYVNWVEPLRQGHKRSFIITQKLLNLSATEQHRRLKWALCISRGYNCMLFLRPD